jgi:hypothetical protein
MNTFPTLKFSICPNQHLLNTLGQASFDFGNECRGLFSADSFASAKLVHAAFPDCEAKRHIGENRYQRVRIKFEHKSSNFISHGYDLAGADMIVCWIHDWHECPLEVLELISAIDELDAN